jgi:hypothetical protein
MRVMIPDVVGSALETIDLLRFKRSSAPKAGRVRSLAATLFEQDHV